MLRTAVSARLDSIRIRLIALLVVVILPLAALAATMTWVSDGILADRPLLIAQQALDLAAARESAIFDGVRDTLHAVAQMPAIIDATPACTPVLAGVVASQPERLAGLAVLDATGHARCGVPVDLATRLAPNNDGFLLGTPSIAGGRLIVNAYYKMPDGSLVAQLDPDITSPAAAGRLNTWLLGDDPSRLSRANDAGLPEPAALRALLALPTGRVLAPDRSGEPAAYAIRAIGPGLHLLAGIRVKESAATGVRPAVSLAAIAALVAVSLVLMALGIERIVVRPMRTLEGAVRRWRGGAAPDAGELDTMPRELRALTLSFADATSALAQREADLRTALSQQELLMQEIHHRVKNNLQIVASLLNLQASRIRQPAARAEFQSARDRVRALATLHRHLYGHGELHTINMREFLDELCVQLFQSFREDVGARIALVIDATELQMSSDQAVPIALLVTEAVSNALKFAFPEGRTGEIRVALAADNNTARLVIEDDGVGLPPDADAKQSREGIGLELIRGFARQLGATLSVSKDDGTRYAIDMKIMQARAAETTGDKSGKGKSASDVKERASF